LAVLESLNCGKTITDAQGGSARRGEHPALLRPAGPTRFEGRHGSRTPANFLSYKPCGKPRRRGGPDSFPGNFPLLMLAWKWGAGPGFAANTNRHENPRNSRRLNGPLRVAALAQGKRASPTGVINMIPGYGETGRRRPRRSFRTWTRSPSRATSTTAQGSFRKSAADNTLKARVTF